LIHPDTELRPADALGLGVFATRAIPRGTIVWVLDELDQQLDPPRIVGLGELMRPSLDRYAYVNARGDSVLCWDHARFVNHSCRANVLSTGWDFDLAVEDIRRGAQLTTDYGCLNLDEPFECLCGAPECRGTIRDEDFDQRAEDWDSRAAGAFSRILDVSQPLWSLLANPVEVQRAAALGLRPPSIALHRRLASPAQRAAGQTQ